jgi:hypothetical protein
MEQVSSARAGRLLLGLTNRHSPPSQDILMEKYLGLRRIDLPLQSTSMIRMLIGVLSRLDTVDSPPS